MIKEDNSNYHNPKNFEHLFGKKHLTFGQKAADFLTKWAGSWIFILVFLSSLILWILINSYFLIQFKRNIFDPFPFIFLNLVLSCIAAIQFPIILMSQNREIERDRIRVEYDYAVNRKAEKEIRELKKSLEEVRYFLKSKK